MSVKYFEDLGSSDVFYKPPKEFNKYVKKEMLKYSIGANLYMNAMKNFYDLIVEGKVKDIACITICFEDALRESDIENSEINVIESLNKLDRLLNNNLENKNIKVPLIFFRVRDYKQFINFSEKLSTNHIKHITGFVFPKFSSNNGELYFERVRELSEQFDDILYAMPILETEQILYKETRIEELLAIKNLIDKYEDIVLNIRVGGTDFSSKFAIRRSVDFNIYDIKVVCECLVDILNIFSRKHSEYVISAPVWEYFSNDKVSREIQGLLREIRLDKENGFCGKTIIHPTQAFYVNILYSVNYDEYIDAKNILAYSEIGGVFKGYNGNKMNEVKPHINWAKKIISRANIYGVFNKNLTYQDVL